ncbi:unnamed protein product [Ilex paraguariensis]|uniref:Uncharacterized protein n=1 Tax=Ilex paraguariensis TaxID=185542 RepID=A0ABC8T532_9AQUA
MGCQYSCLSRTGYLDKSRKRKLQSLSYITRISNKGSRKDILDAVSPSKKKRRLKHLATERKTKTCTASKFIAKHQKPEMPVRGILKNHSKLVWDQNSTICNLQEVTQLNHCSPQQSNRHVQFTGKDDILEQRRKAFTYEECPELQPICSFNFDAIAASSVKEGQTERGKNLGIVMMNGSKKDASISTENETDFLCLTEKQLPVIGHVIDSPNYPHVRCEEHLLDRTVNGNLHLLEQRYKTASHDPLYASTPRFLSLANDGYTPNVVTHVGRDISRASSNSGMLIDQSGDPRPRPAAMCSTDHMKAFPQPSSTYFTSCYGNASGWPPFPSQTTADNNNGHALPYQPFHHMSPKELMSSICSLPEWKQKMAACREKCMGEDFVGLPLNSQGELIQSNSSGNGRYQLMRSSTSGSAMSFTVNNNAQSKSPGDDWNFRNCGSRAPPKDALKLFPVQDCVKGNPDLAVACRLGFPELQGVGRTKDDFLDCVRRNDHPVYPLESELDWMNISHHGHKQYDQVQKGNGNGKVQALRDRMSLNVTQPTMRLMGKEFTVARGNTDLQGLEDGNVWTDKQIIAEYRPPKTSIVNCPVNKQNQQDSIVHPASEKLQDTMAASSEFKANQVSPSVLPVKPTESRSSLPYLDCQTDVVYNNRCDTINLNPIPELASYSPPAASFGLYNRAPIFQVPFTCGYESLNANSPIPIVASSPHKTSQNTNSYSASPKNRLNLPHATKSSFKFPFLRPDCGDHFQPSWYPNSMPQRFPDTPQQKGILIGSFKSNSDATSSHHPCNISENNFYAGTTVYRSPEISYAYNPVLFHSPLPTPLASASFSHPTVMPVCPEFPPLPAINNKHGNRMKFKGQIKSRVILKSRDHGKKTNKRPAALSDDCTKPTKKPNLVVQQVSSFATQPLKVTGGLDDDVQCGTSFELDAAKDKASSMGCGQNSTQNKGSRVISVIESSKLENSPKLGPIKLTAGAKHILKPSHLDQNNSRPFHSTIPFAEATSSGWVSESNGKSAKMYSF